MVLSGRSVALAATASALVVTSIAYVWTEHRALEQRVIDAERRLAQLEPIRALLAAQRPAAEIVGKPYGAAQAVGPADVAKPGGDDPRAWCPAAPDERSAWLELGYATPVPTRSVRVHATFNPGGIVRITGSVRGGADAVLWEGHSGPEIEAVFPLAQPRELDRVRLHFNLDQDPSWREIDAVCLIDASGGVHWATTAKASSEWSPPPAAR